MDRADLSGTLGLSLGGVSVTSDPGLVAAVLMRPDLERKLPLLRVGRLTLNMLLSFAQLEREVTGERIADIGELR